MARLRGGAGTVRLRSVTADLPGMGVTGPEVSVVKLPDYRSLDACTLTRAALMASMDP